MSQARRFRVVIVEDHTMVAEGLTALLEDERDIEVMAAVGTAAEAVRSARELRPDVVLMDFRLPDQSGAEAAATIRQEVPEAALVFLSADDSEAAQVAAVEAGAAAYLLKWEASAQLVTALRRAATGEVLIKPEVFHRLLASRRREERERRAVELVTDRLTVKELEVLHLIARGLTSQEIAEAAGIGSATVRTHVRSLLQKLDVHTRLQAVLQAAKLGLLEA